MVQVLAPGAEGECRLGLSMRESLHVTESGCVCVCLMQAVECVCVPHGGG